MVARLPHGRRAKRVAESSSNSSFKFFDAVYRNCRAEVLNRIEFFKFVEMSQANVAYGSLFNGEALKVAEIAKFLQTRIGNPRRGEDQRL